jgi:hypothetical protein
VLSRYNTARHDGRFDYWRPAARPQKRIVPQSSKAENSNLRQNIMTISQNHFSIVCRPLKKPA